LVPDYPPHCFPTRRSSDLAAPYPGGEPDRIVGCLGAVDAGEDPKPVATLLAQRLKFLLREHLVPGDLRHGFPSDPFQQWPVEHRSEEHTSELQSRENLVCR